MREFGGFLELELNSDGNLYHNEALSFNSGSSALLFYLNTSKAQTIHLPYFTCSTVLETIEKTNKAYKFYNINLDLEPNIDFNTFKNSDLLIYNDYFGVNQNNVQHVLKKTSNVLIDACQSFYFITDKQINIFNSVRKFYGTPDGGFLYMKNKKGFSKIYQKLKPTAYHFEHLIDRLENNAQSAYKAFLENENIISKNEIGKMSKLTKSLLYNVNFEKVKEKRLTNFNTLHSNLKFVNEWSVFNKNQDEVPLCYPFLIKNGYDLKKHLIHKNIYTPTYWPEIEKYMNSSCEVEKYLINNLVCLPIDQRYNKDDMLYILKTVKDFIN